ncbi:MAG: NUDIX hydrolase [Tissierellia bacterium]|nr:NUDIX hydrolase [Tissierellia bacterium]
MIFDEKTIKTEKIYNGKILNLRVDTVELENKKYSKREIVEHSGGVGMLAINEENEVILVRQFRKAAERDLLEIPAGKLEINEEPRETAIRELKEETGYTAENVSYMTEFFATPGYCTEKIYIFKATNLTLGDRDLDDSENIEVEYYSLEEALKMIERGEILDAKTIIALTLFKIEKGEN